MRTGGYEYAWENRGTQELVREGHGQGQCMSPHDRMDVFRFRRLWEAQDIVCSVEAVLELRRLFKGMDLLRQAGCVQGGQKTGL